MSAMIGWVTRASRRCVFSKSPALARNCDRASSGNASAITSRVRCTSLLMTGSTRSMETSRRIRSSASLIFTSARLSASVAACATRRFSRSTRESLGRLTLRKSAYSWLSGSNSPFFWICESMNALLRRKKSSNLPGSSLYLPGSCVAANFASSISACSSGRNSSLGSSFFSGSAAGAGFRPSATSRTMSLISSRENRDSGLGSSFFSGGAAGAGAGSSAGDSTFALSSAAGSAGGVAVPSSAGLGSSFFSGSGVGASVMIAPSVRRITSFTGSGAACWVSAGFTSG